MNDLNPTKLERYSELIPREEAERKLARELRKEAANYVLRPTVILSHSRHTLKPHELVTWGVFSVADNLFCGRIKPNRCRGTKLFMDSRYTVIEVLEEVL